jgi:hypothetical protein
MTTWVGTGSGFNVTTWVGTGSGSGMTTWVGTGSGFNVTTWVGTGSICLDILNDFRMECTMVWEIILICLNIELKHRNWLH